jgi:hypothetical protein
MNAQALFLWKEPTSGTVLVDAEPDPSQPRKSRVVWVLSDPSDLPAKKSARG